MESEREMYLAICQTCLKSKFDRKKGLVCTLTNEHANFNLNSTCPDYDIDEKFTRIQSAAKRRVSAAMEDDSTAAFWRPASPIFLIVGAILCICGTFNFLWVIKFGFSPIGLFFSIAGLVIFSKGLIEFNKLRPGAYQHRHNQNVPPANEVDHFGDFDDLEEM